jgi:signal transduction histidine kinase
MTFGAKFLFRRRQAAWWTLVAGLVLTALLGWHLHREAVKLDQQRLALRVAEITSQLDSRLEKSEMLLHNLRDYLMLSGERRNQVFQRWCYENGLSINCRWIHGIAVATNRHKVQWRSQMPADPETWIENDWETLRRLALQHPIECDIALTSEVRDQKQFLTDYDLRPSSASVNARPSGWFSGSGDDWLGFTIRLSSRLGMSDRRTVMLDANSNPITGTLFYVPIHRSEFANLMVDESIYKRARNPARWLDFESLIIAPVDFGVLAQSIWDGAPADVGIEIFSSTNQTAETWLNLSEGIPRATDPAFKPYLAHRQMWRMYGLKFSIYFYTTPLFEAQSPRRLAKVAMAAGAALTLLASALVGVAQRAHNRQELLTEQIREARDALAAAQQERNKISRDLHHGTIQSLYAIQLGLDHLVEKLEAEPSKARRELSAMRTELDAVIAEIRQFITAEAGADKPVDFSAVLQALVQRASPGTTAKIASHCDAVASQRLSGDQAVQLAGIVRETLSNSLRHGKPQRVEIALYSDFETLVLEISDDGTGFDPTAPRRVGVGLTSMTARTQEMGGTLDIQSAPGKGTRVVVRVPAGLSETTETEEPDDNEDES